SQSPRCTKLFMRDNVMGEMQQLEPGDETKHRHTEKRLVDSDLSEGDHSKDHVLVLLYVIVRDFRSAMLTPFWNMIARHQSYGAVWAIEWCLGWTDKSFDEWGTSTID
ncbi:hypothetical protein Tco_0610176, partial [Tanacetum coccineum]